MKIRTILHATDFSRPSAHAWHMACALADNYGAKVIVLHVRQNAIAACGEFGTLPPESIDTEALGRELAGLEPPVDGLTIERRLGAGDPAEEIVRIAKQNQCDLIVLGTHGRTGLGRLLMGSVAEQVVRKAPCPVLTVKTPTSATATLQLAREEAAPVV